MPLQPSIADRIDPSGRHHHHHSPPSTAGQSHSHGPTPTGPLPRAHSHGPIPTGGKGPVPAGPFFWPRGGLGEFKGLETTNIAGWGLASVVSPGDWRRRRGQPDGLLKLDEAHAAHVIFSAGQEVSADLIVVGTHGRAGVAQLLLGSVAQEVLHIADRDVLAGSMLRH
ncbi:MAG: universal stress protein [Alphaproteobacteria bacterium]|nr:universal stress protein [Alphaproteobacteria bacterium]